MPDAPDGLSALVVATQLSAPVPGGTGRYAANVLRSLEVSRPAGAGLTAYLCGDVAPDCGLELPAGLASRRAPVGFRALARLWERGLPPRAPDADLVHATTLMVPPTRAGSRLVVTVHDVVPWTHPETLTPRGVAFHRRMAERVARTADLLLTPTAVVAQRLEQLLQPACPVRVVPP
ncbi:MAG: glycosyltransferase, partial [Actinomycetota bacterium]|nr:glycosyltransferase [Actinomycetota bacterium]